MQAGAAEGSTPKRRRGPAAQGDRQRARGGGGRWVHPDNRSAAAALSEAQRPCRACSGNPPCEFHECRSIPDDLAEASRLVGAFSRAGSSGPGPELPRTPGAGAAPEGCGIPGRSRSGSVSCRSIHAEARPGMQRRKTKRPAVVRDTKAAQQSGQRMQKSPNPDGSSVADAMAIAVQARARPRSAERRARLARRPCSREFRGNGEVRSNATLGRIPGRCVAGGSARTARNRTT